MKQKKLVLRFNKVDISVFLLAVISLTLLSPVVERTVGDIAIILLTGFYLLLNINHLIKSSTQERNTIILIFVYIAMMFLYKFIGFSTASMNYHYAVIRFFFAFLCIIPLYKRIDRGHMIFLLVVMIGTMFITMFQNFLLKASLGDGYSLQLYKSGVKAIMSTQYTCAILVLEGALFCGFLHKKGSWIRFLYLGLSILCIVFNLLVMQRGIILVLTLVMLPLLVLFNSRKRTVRRFVTVTIVMALLIVVVMNYARVLNFIGDISGSDRIAVRMRSIVTMIERGSVEGAGDSSLAARFELIGRSMQTFFGSFEHFLIGVGNRTDSNQLVGNHSQIFDEFARYGIFGGILSIAVVLNMLFTSRKMFLSREDGPLYLQFTIINIIVIIRAFIGSIEEAAIGTSLFIILPLFFKLLKDDEDVRI